MTPGQDEIGASFVAQVVPKKDLMVLMAGMLAERDGKRYAVHEGVETEIPAHVTVVMEGAPMEQAQLDVVILCRAALIKKSVLMPNGRMPVAEVTVAEVGRISLDEFLTRADAAIRESSAR